MKQSKSLKRYTENFRRVSEKAARDENVASLRKQRTRASLVPVRSDGSVAIQAAISAARSRKA